MPGFIFLQDSLRANPIKNEPDVILSAKQPLLCAYRYVKKYYPIV